MKPPVKAPNVIDPIAPSTGRPPRAHRRVRVGSGGLLGGVDSTLVAAVVKEQLGDSALACIGASASLAAREFEQAVSVADQIGLAYRVIDTLEHLRRPLRFQRRRPLLRLQIAPLRAASGNRDAGRFGAGIRRRGPRRRPRRPPSRHQRRPRACRAVSAAGIRIDQKQGPRACRRLGLPVWDKPASPCLASRVPRGTEITPRLLKQIEQAEDVLAGLGFRQFRVRHHGELAHIELAALEMGRAMELREHLVAGVHAAGYRFVTLDLAGFRAEPEPAPVAPADLFGSMMAREAAAYTISAMDATASIPVNTDDSINARILAESEDKIQGFQADPLGQIARQSGVDRETVTERIAAMLRAGTIRRVRQTLMATNLARGAWSPGQSAGEAERGIRLHVPPGPVQRARRDPLDQCADDRVEVRLWTTLKVPQGYSMRSIAGSWPPRPAQPMNADAGQAAVRPGRRPRPPARLEPGSKSDELAEVHDTNIVELSDLDWRVLTALKREFEPGELRLTSGRPAPRGGESIWKPSAAWPHLNERKVIGRFSTFLEHVKTLKTGEQVTKYNALFHWAVPPATRSKRGGRSGASTS